MLTAHGFALRDSAASLLRQFDPNFVALPSKYQDNPNGYLGSVALINNDGKVIGKLTAEIDLQCSGRSRNYRCVLQVSAKSRSIPFKTRSLKMKDSGKKVAATINDYISQIDELEKIEESTNIQTKETYAVNLKMAMEQMEKVTKDVASISNFELYPFFGSKEVTIKTYINGKLLKLNFNDSMFEVELLGLKKSLTAEQLITVLKLF